MKMKAFLASLAFGCSFVAVAEPALLGCTIESSGQPIELKPTSTQLTLFLRVDVQRRSAQMMKGVLHDGSPAVLESWTDKLIVFAQTADVRTNTEMKVLERTRFDQNSGRFEITYDFLNARGQTMMRADVLEDLKRSDAWGLHPGLTYAGMCKKLPQ